MKILVTGASGFIGQVVLYELLKREHRVIALVRSAPDRWSNLKNLEVIQSDLLQAERLDLRDRGIDVAVHLAATVTKRPAGEQFEDTVTGTVNLLSAARRAGIRRIVGIGSIAVLDYRAVPPMTVIDEQVARSDGMEMGDYAASKLQQETLFVAFGNESGNSCTILRPGLIYDKSRLGAAHAGIIKGRLSLLVSHRGEVPTIQVDGLARAIANATEIQLDGCNVMHLVDDHLPGQSEYIAGLRRRGLLPPITIVIPWRALQGLCAFTRTTLAAIGLCRKLPEFFLARNFSARLEPFRFSNTKATRLLHWTP
jgi:nucleoside-diphosphate-sugar epimerase